MVTFDEAMRYKRRGWSVIPVRRDKKPACRSWKQCQETPARDAQMSRWFKDKQ